MMPHDVEENMRSQAGRFTARNLLFIAIVTLLACILTISVHSQSAPKKEGSSSEPQKTFNNPQEAATALIQAAGTYDTGALLEILGPEGKALVSSADPVKDKSLAQAFAAKAKDNYTVNVDPNNKTRAILSVGTDDWPFPVPIVRKDAKWYFDSKQGSKEILFRRIGANELDAIQICRGFVEAQQEYASEIHDNSGVNQYAQKVMSTAGKHDGLYWKNADGTSGGPIGEAVARAIEEGYSPDKPGYHGYYFKVLKGQGPAAPLGQLDYVIEGAMIGGFALVAVPAQYRVTGVKTFMVSYDGVVYEKDLGPDSINIAKQMETYNPDPSWHRTDDQWPAEALAASN